MIKRRAKGGNLIKLKLKILKPLLSERAKILGGVPVLSSAFNLISDFSTVYRCFLVQQKWGTVRTVVRYRNRILKKVLVRFCIEENKNFFGTLFTFPITMYLSDKTHPRLALT